LAALIRDDWKGLLESMKGRIGVLAGFLVSARPKLEEEGLVVEVPPGPLLEELGKKKAGDALALLIEGRTGKRPAVKFRASSDLVQPAFAAASPVSPP